MAPYFSTEGVRKLKSYQYHGTDHSLIYRYVLTPMNNWLMDNVIPRWIAPNVITLLGLMAVGFQYLHILTLSPQMDQPLASWVCAVTSIALFTYQTLDNLDGKQARKTGSGSPLGLLFDHGCDAINCAVGTTTCASVLMLGALSAEEFAIQRFLFINIGIFPFFWATWEEYFVGSLDLPIVNGPTEGLLFLVVVYAFSAATDLSTGFWSEKSNLLEPLGFPEVPRNAIIGHCAFGGAIFSAFLAIFNVVRHAMGQKNTASRLFAAARHAAPIFAIEVLAYTFIAESRFGAHNVLPHAGMWSTGFCFANVATRLMVLHLCEEGAAARPIRVALTILSFTGAYRYLVYSSGLVTDLESECTAVLATTAFCGLMWVKLTLDLCLNVAAALNIPILTLPAKCKSS